MKHSKECHDIVRQNDKNVKKSQKHDANLQKNSTLYFQIGLIMCLLASYTALEMTFAATAVDAFAYKDKPIDDFAEYTMDDFVIEKDPEVIEKPEPEKQQPKEPEEFEVVDNNKKVKETFEKVFKKEEPKKGKPVLSTNDKVLDVEPIDEVVSILAVQKVPVYPGCESETTNDGRRKCMSEKLGKLVQKKFDTDLGSELGLSGLQKIYVLFKINKSGNVEILNARAPHPQLEKEAKRVVDKIPTMIPGSNDQKPVNVLYTLPISFNVRN